MTATRQILDLLSRYESRNIAFMAPDGSWPIVWRRARGAHVWDAEGKRYLDLTAAFGVAAAGHANPRVVRAGQRQMEELLHAMGDVHPHAQKARLARELSRLTFERWSRSGSPALTGKTVFCNSGFEAVEAALKTAHLATGKRGVIAFEGGYHGLGYGALSVTHRSLFRGPFLSQLGAFGHFLPFPCEGSIGKSRGRLGSAGASGALGALDSALRRLLRRHRIGAILAEPVQGRGGIRIPTPGFLTLLRRVCDAHKILLVLDEVYTGFGRTGKWFACEHERVTPDLVCLGKALSGGFPLSACVGRADLMDAAWPPSQGEAIHTSTFLGHPVGCAMALAQIREIERSRLVQRSERTGRELLAGLRALAQERSSVRMEARGMGLMAGLELVTWDGEPATSAALRAVTEMLRRGFILLPEGDHGNVLGFTPPLTITAGQMARALAALRKVLS